jgi:hypothetical protein
MLGDFIVGFGGLACSAWRLVALCRWPPHPKTALIRAASGGERPELVCESIDTAQQQVGCEISISQCC